MCANALCHKLRVYQTVQVWEDVFAFIRQILLDGVTTCGSMGVVFTRATWLFYRDFATSNSPITLLKKPGSMQLLCYNAKRITAVPGSTLRTGLLIRRREV